CRTLDDVEDARTFHIDAINDARIAERTCVVRLSAAGRIKCSAIQPHRDCSVVALVQIDHARVKFKQARIVIIESFSCAHSWSDVIKCGCAVTEPRTVAIGSHTQLCRICWVFLSPAKAGSES